MQKRKHDIDVLLESCERGVREVQGAYDASLHDKDISPELQVKIKNICENLRSALDYIAHDLLDAFCGGASKSRIYFPIFSTREDFQSQAKNWFPGLKASKPDLWDYLEGLQPYHSAYNWLGIFGEITNQNKHRNLVPQERNETEEVRVVTPSGSISWKPNGVKFGSGVFIGGVPVDPRTQLPVPHPSQKVERILWVDFVFEGSNISALGLVKQALIGIKKIAEEIGWWF